MKAPLIVKRADAEDREISHIARLERMKENVDRFAPSVDDIRKAKIKPEMTAKERLAYRDKMVGRGGAYGAFAGSILGGAAGTTVSALLRRSGMPKQLPRTSNALTQWVIPGSSGYIGYMLGSVKGKQLGERYARGKLGRSGNEIPYIDPIQSVDKKAFKPGALIPMLGVKTLQTAVGKKTNDSIEKAINYV